MVSESEIIEIINSVIPSGENRETACFESDAEVLKFNASKMLLTTDEFSAEDLLPEEDGYTLGWNIAAGAITDITATGGIPLYYSHALTVSREWGSEYIIEFATGVAAVLHKYDITFAGGDVGISEQFRCTATVIGKPSKRIVSRRGADAGDKIYLTGKVGSGNLNAALSIYKNSKALSLTSSKILTRYSPRPKAAQLISRYASAAIDTSDGVFNAINTVAELNSLGFSISDIPYCKKGVIAAKILSLPKELLLLGECGEYELLFTIPAVDESSFLKEASKAKLPVYHIGQMVHDSAHKVLQKKRTITLGRIFRAREFETVKEYLSALIDWIKTW